MPRVEGVVVEYADIGRITRGGVVRLEQVRSGALVASARGVALLVGHEICQPAAAAIELDDGPLAMRFRAEVPEEIAEQVADGRLAGVSPGYNLPKWSTKVVGRTAIRQLLFGELREVSLVPVAMSIYPKSVARVI